MPLPTKPNYFLALDIGDRRVGVAIASTKTMLAKPLLTLTNDQDLISNLNKLVKEYEVQTLVIGLPRNLSGNDSSQTEKVRQTIDELKHGLKVEMVTQDEALSSVRAQEELTRRGKIFARADIDKLAACLILEDYITGIKS